MAFEKLYTAEDVSQITGLTLRTIRNYINSGRLKGHRVGVQWRFTEADIQALFAGSSPTSDTAITTSAPAPAAPVMDAAAIAAISVAIPTFRYDDGQQADIVAALKEQAAHISRTIEQTDAHFGELF